VQTESSSINRLVTAILIGTGAELLMGSRTVKTYVWRTEWLIHAPLPTVYEAMTSRSAVRLWWPSIELVDEAGEDALRVGSTVSFSVHQAPNTDVEPESRLREVVTEVFAGWTDAPHGYQRQSQIPHPGQ
jgi:hypothetical protein